jgi:teichuronic acid biosynthesis glycosyltransferase TuaC
MKILLVTNMYPADSRSFYGIFVQEYVEQMRTMGLEMDLFFTDARMSRFQYLKDIPRLKAMAGQKSYDIFHAQHTFSVYQIMLSGIRKRKKPNVLLTLHEAEVLIPQDVRSSSMDVLGSLVFSKKMKLHALNSVSHVVSVESTMPKVIGYKLPYSVIPPGIDTKLFFPKSKVECRQKLGLSLDCPIVLFPADPQRSIHKGFAFLEKALSFLSSDIKLICGGNIPHHSMVDYMNASDVVVQTSNFEASPMVMKEAMACNIPIVSTDVGDVRWLIGDTAGCYICEREPNSIAQKLQLALDFNNRTNGRDRINELDISLEGIARKYLQLYEKLR